MQPDHLIVLLPTCRDEKADVRNEIQQTAQAACTAIVARAKYAVWRERRHDLPEQTAWATASHATARRAAAPTEPGLPFRHRSSQRFRFRRERKGFCLQSNLPQNQIVLKCSSLTLTLCSVPVRVFVQIQNCTFRFSIHRFPDERTPNKTHTMEFWVRFPNERNQGKQAHPVLKYRVPHGSHLIAHVLHSPPPTRTAL